MRTGFKYDAQRNCGRSSTGSAEWIARSIGGQTGTISEYHCTSRLRGYAMCTVRHYYRSADTTSCRGRQSKHNATDCGNHPKFRTTFDNKVVTVCTSIDGYCGAASGLTLQHKLCAIDQF